MKTKLYILLFFLGFFSFHSHSQPSLAESQVIEFSNLSASHNYYSGEIYCFDDTKITLQLRTSSLSGKFHGTIIFAAGNKSYTVTSENEDYFREVVQTLPKGKTTLSINLLPDIENNYRADASILIFATSKGRIGTNNILATIEK